MEPEIFLPTLSSMEYGNVWTGSHGAVRFRIVPKEGVMTTELWRGPLCYECSQVIETEQFPISPEGIESLRAWLMQHE